MEPTLTARLEALAEASYREFTQSLIPDGKPLMGIRMGPLRALAKELASEGYDSFQALSGDRYHEETMLRALVIAYLKVPETHRIVLLERFLPSIDNWAVCDSLCTTITGARAAQEEYLAFIASHIEDPHPYAVRFAVVMLLFHFLQSQFLNEVCNLLVRAEREHYYVRMAVAWTAATAYARFPDRISPWLSTRPFQEATMRMTIQKIRDSRQVSAEGKAWAASMRSYLRGNNEGKK